MENTDSFHFHVKLGDNDFADGYDKNKQSAKRLAAENLLSKLNSTLLESIVISLPPAPKKGLLKHEMNSKNQPQEKKHVHFVDDQLMITQQRLTHACQKLDIQIQFEDQMINDQYESILSLTKNDKLLAKFRGNGLILADAQENASKAAWKNLHELFNK
jgi:uncharacterized protein YpiB (UPF0302 family)